MSEFPTEKVYLRTVLGAVFLVDSLGRILGRQRSFEVSGAHSSFIEARITVEPDGSWSPEVAKEYLDSCGGVSGWLSGKVASNETGSAVELDLPGFSSGSLLINGEKFVREQAGAPEKEKFPCGILDIRHSEELFGIDIKMSSAFGPGHINVNGAKFERNAPLRVMSSDFNRLLELFPEIARAMAEQRGMTVGGLRTAAAHGKITFEEVGLSASRLAVRPQNAESKLSVEVDTSEIASLAKEVEDALERDRQYWREMAASGGIQGAQVGELHSFPICPLESAISETVRHLREGQEFNLKAPPEVQRPDEPNQMLAQHLKKLLSAQYERMSK